MIITTPIDNDAKRDRILTSLPTVFTQLDTVEQKLSLGIYNQLAKGLPVDYASLAKILGIEVGVIENIIGKWPAVYHDEKNRIIAYWGLALSEMPHRLTIADQILYAWCAWDSLFIPQLINKTTEIHSRCGTSNQVIEILISPTGIESISPSSAVMSFIASEGEQIEDDIINQFCHYVLFFYSADNGSQWIEQHPGSFLMTIEDGFALGQRKNCQQFSNLH